MRQVGGPYSRSSMVLLLVLRPALEELRVSPDYKVAIAPFPAMRHTVAAFVPYQTPCPKCEHVGLVRAENVITGTSCMRLFYCGRCEHQWSVLDTPTLPPSTSPPTSKRRTQSSGPARRRRA